MKVRQATAWMQVGAVCLLLLGSACAQFANPFAAFTWQAGGGVTFPVAGSSSLFYLQLNAGTVIDSFKVPADLLLTQVLLVGSGGASGYNYGWAGGGGDVVTVYNVQRRAGKVYQGVVHLGTVCTTAAQGAPAQTWLQACTSCGTGTYDATFNTVYASGGGTGALYALSTSGKCVQGGTTYNNMFCAWQPATIAATVGQPESCGGGGGGMLLSGGAVIYGAAASCASSGGGDSATTAMGGGGGATGSAAGCVGGAGQSSSVTGLSVCYGGGGAGGTSSATGCASSCGGGTGSTSSVSSCTAGVNGGGGGSRHQGVNSAGCAGGAGVLILQAEGLACAPGTFGPVCATCSACSAAQFTTQACTPSNNTVCAAWPACAGGYFIDVPNSQCSQCAAGACPSAPWPVYLACTPHAPLHVFSRRVRRLDGPRGRGHTVWGRHLHSLPHLRDHGGPVLPRQHAHTVPWRHQPVCVPVCPGVLRPR